MKLSDLFEQFTTATSVGDIAYHTSQKNVHLYRHCGEKKKYVKIASIRRENHDGWRFNVTDQWKESNLPHLGHSINRRIKDRGRKTIEGNIDSILKELGIRCDSVSRLEVEEDGSK